MGARRALSPTLEHALHLPPLCSRISPERIRGRKRALDELQGFTAEYIAELKHQQDGEFLQGEPALRGALLCCKACGHSARMAGGPCKMMLACQLRQHSSA